MDAIGSIQGKLQLTNTEARQLAEYPSDEQIYQRAVVLVRETRKASVPWVQHHLKVGYNRAHDLIDRMEAEGIISPCNHVGKREVLA